MSTVHRKQTTRKNPDGTRAVILSKKWYGTINGKRIPLTYDKRVSEQLLRTMQAEALKGNFGIGPKNPMTAKKPLAEHIADFRAMIAERHTRSHATHAARCVTRIAEALEWRTLAQLNAEAAAGYIAAMANTSDAITLPDAPTEYRHNEAAAILGVTGSGLQKAIILNALEAGQGNGKARRVPRSTVQALLDNRGKGVSPRTRNVYRIHLKHFGSWLEETGRVLKNPFAHGLKAERTEADIRKRRRALTTEEVQQLLTVTRTGPDRYDLTGSARCLLYALAFVTGFRRSALAALTPAQFDLEAIHPTVTLTAKTSKNKKSQVNPLPVDLAEELRHFLTGHPRTAPIWSGRWHANAAKMARADLKAAGIASKTFDAHGPVYVDFHGLRHTALTHAARSAPLHVVQRLAGHSSPVVTAKYTHADAADLRTAIENITTRPKPATEAINSNSHLPAICPPFARTGYSEVQSEVSFDNTTGKNESADGVDKSLKALGNVNILQFVTPLDLSGSAGIRTQDQRIKSQNEADCKPLQGNSLTSITTSICPPFARDPATPVPPGTPSDPSNLARLLGELAALPLEQRTALAALLGSMPSMSAPSSTPPRLDDRCPLDRPVGKPTGQ